MFSLRLRRAALTVAATTTMITLAACGGDHDGSGADHDAAAPASGTAAPASGSAAPASGSAAPATFNDADVMFAQMMIVHHRQAVEMAAMADAQATDAGVKGLAKRIEAAQQPELDTMTGWLTAWGRPVALPNDHDSAHGGSMPGMMTDADMGKLSAAKGAEFDKRFLTMMIAHHEGAVTMAEDEIADGSNAEVEALAQHIVTTQQAEITTMKELLARE